MKTIPEIMAEIEEYVNQRPPAIPTEARKITYRRPRIPMHDFTHFENYKGQPLCTSRKAKGITISKTIEVINCETCMDMLRGWGNKI